MLAAALVIAVAGPASVARAQAEEAESLIRQGVELRKEGKDALALPFFEKAYQNSRNPRTAAQLGLGEMALGYWVEAQRHLGEAVAARDNPWVKKNARMLGESLAKVRSMVGELTITGEPDGADVTVNGQSVGKLPLAGPLHLGKGEIEVELRAPGYEHASKTVSLAGGTPESVSIVLARTSPPPDRPVATVATAPPSVRAADAASTAAPAATTIIAPAQGTEPVSGTPSSALRPVAWVAGGVGVAGLAFGVIETLVMTDKQNAFNNHTAPSPTPTDPNRRLPDCTTANLTTDCSQLRDSYQSARTLAIIGYVAGAALTATSAVLFVLSRPSPETRVGLTAACVPTLDTPGVSCLLRF